MRFLRRKQAPEPVEAGTPAAELAAGWNDLPWGAPLATFRARFPAANQTGEWWRTGADPESFCGVRMAIVQYGFNHRHELCLVTFIPEMEDREMFSPTVINTLGLPAGNDLRWVFGDVEVDVKSAGIMATMTNRRYAAR